jgi:hypothetical protein
MKQDQCQMSNVKVQMKSKAQMTKLKREKVLTLIHFGIHLTFACLPVGRDFDI